MPYSLDKLPDAVKNKSEKAKKAFLAAYNSATERGLSDEEALFAGLAAMKNAEKPSERTKKALEPLKPKVPSHLAAVLQKRAVEPSSTIPEPLVKQNSIKQEFLGKNALVADPERSLVSADFNEKNQLVLQFDTGEKITTKPINIDENIENYVTLSQEKIQGPEPTGFVNRTDSSITFNNTTRTFTIAPVSEGYMLWLAGGEIHKVQSDSITIPNTTGLYYIYFDVDDSVLKYTGTYTSALLSRQAMVSILYWQVDQQQAIYFADERHGMLMDGVTQAYLHQTNGTVYRSGLGLTNIIVDGNGSLSSHAQFSVTDGRIADEDIDIVISNNSPQVLSTIAQIPIFYRLGSSSNWYKTEADNYPFLMPGDSPNYSGLNRPAYNFQSNNIWSLSEVGNNDFFLVHVIATNNINEPIIAVLGGTYATKSAVYAGAQTELANIIGLPFAEFLPLATVLYESADSYTNITNARIVSTEEGGSYIDWRSSNNAAASVAPALPSNIVKGYFTSINLVANTPYIVTHNLQLVNQNAFTLNCMFNNQQVNVQATSIDSNSLSITAAIAVEGLIVTVTGFSSG